MTVVGQIYDGQLFIILNIILFQENWTEVLTENMTYLVSITHYCYFSLVLIVSGYLCIPIFCYSMDDRQTYFL